MALEDYLNHLKGFYRTSPNWFKRTVGYIYASLPWRIRHGSVFVKTRKLLNESQWWSWQQHREYQWQQMETLVHHAYANVPYYRSVMDRLGLKADDIRSIENWQKLPYLTKDIVKERKEDLVAENMRNRKVAANTGGSTARPLELYWERNKTQSMERAFMLRQWEWGGFRANKRKAILGGRTVKEELYHYDPVDKQLFVNAYNLSDENGSVLLAKLRSFKPRSIHAYPSTLTLLASYMKRHDESLDDVRVLLCGSENLYPAQKELFQEIFRARVYSWYGHAESSCLAGYCDKEDYYHVYSEYGYVELVDEDGNVLPWTEGQRGEIVATSLINNTMPFIRYRTGDIGIAGPAECSCGRHYKLLAKIEGRKQEYIVTSDGRLIALTGLIFGQHWHAFSKMQRLQIVQNERGKIIVKIVKGPGFDEEDEKEIRHKISTCVRSGLEVGFEYVDAIPTSSRGKHIFVKQSLSLFPIGAGNSESSGFSSPS